MDALGSYLTLDWMASSIDRASFLLAYIDPGSGSLVFQIVVAGLLTVGLMIRGLRDQALCLLRMPLKLFKSAGPTVSESTTTNGAATTSRGRQTTANQATIKKAA